MFKSFDTFVKREYMLQSMTGFGKATGTYNGKKIVVELRALNSKSFDLYLKLPSLFKEKEIDVRKILGNNLDRGKIEAIISIENTGDTNDYVINKSLVTKYYNELKDFSDGVGADVQNLIASIVRFPNVLVSQEDELSEEQWSFLEKCLLEAITKLKEFRLQEGASLKLDFENRIGEIDRLLKDVPKYESARIENIRERMRKGLEEAKNVDENRFEQELIFYIEKLDVSEEKVRLENHLNYFKETINTGGVIGKKIGFISQEIGREINTLGSKAQHSELQKLVVNMKDNLEKIKEQVLNTL